MMRATPGWLPSHQRVAFDFPWAMQDVGGMLDGVCERGRVQDTGQRNVTRVLFVYYPDTGVIRFRRLRLLVFQTPPRQTPHLRQLRRDAFASFCPGSLH